MSEGPTRVLFEAGDVARALGLSYSGVRVLVERGDLHPVAQSRRGVRYFDPADVEVLRLRRASRRPSMPGRRKRRA